ncbi:MAG: peptidoglycan editing factor PgeF [Hyphomicrobium sp.]|nr:peptidoglycan editing factor PgeF [Hyphomicrobium sp.]
MQKPLAPATSPLLDALPGIRHGFFTREGGISLGIYASLNCGLGSGDDPQKVLENRGRVAAHLGAAMPEVVTLYQTHSAVALAVAHAVARDDLPKADAVVTATPGLAVGVLTADCAPVLFADPVARVVAAAHAGWRGAKGGILAATVAEMERLGAVRSRITATVGPCISQSNYEVGPEFEADFVAGEAADARFFMRTEPFAKPHFDLQGLVLDRLARLGIAAASAVNMCTYGNESILFSYRRTQHRREPEYGRQISAIVVT